jgi:hypothetical protein
LYSACSLVRADLDGSTLSKQMLDLDVMLAARKPDFSYFIEHLGA